METKEQLCSYLKRFTRAERLIVCKVYVDEFRAKPGSVVKLADKMKVDLLDWREALMSINSVINKITQAAQNSNDLAHKKYERKNAPLASMCYPASEAIFHMWGRYNGFEPHQVNHEGVSHWFLKNPVTSQVIDATSAQFETPVNYAAGKRRAFFTKLPSKRAKILLQRAGVCN